MADRSSRPRCDWMLLDGEGEAAITGLRSAHGWRPDYIRLAIGRPRNGQSFHAAGPDPGGTARKRPTSEGWYPFTGSWRGKGAGWVPVHVLLSDAIRGRHLAGTGC